MDTTAVKLHSTTDAQVWTQEFFRIFDAKFMRIEDGAIFETEEAADLLLTWFANAIETGRSHAQSTALDKEDGNDG